VVLFWKVSVIRVSVPHVPASARRKFNRANSLDRFPPACGARPKPVFTGEFAGRDISGRVTRADVQLQARKTMPGDVVEVCQNCGTSHFMALARPNLGLCAVVCCVALVDLAAAVDFQQGRNGARESNEKPQPALGTSGAKSHFFQRKSADPWSGPAPAAI